MGSSKEFSNQMGKIGYILAVAVRHSHPYVDCDISTSRLLYVLNTRCQGELIHTFTLSKEKPASIEVFLSTSFLQIGLGGNRIDRHYFSPPHSLGLFQFHLTLFSLGQNMRKVNTVTKVFSYRIGCISPDL